MSEAPFRLTDDMLAVIEATHLCFCATVTPDGLPNLSPKGTIRAWDERRLFFLDIASPRTRANLEHRPVLELNVVDPLSRRGYRFRGTATLHVGDDVHRKATRRIRMEEGVRYEAAATVLIDVAVGEPVVSPGYLHVPDETAMRIHMASDHPEWERDHVRETMKRGAAALMLLGLFGAPTASGQTGDAEYFPMSGGGKLPFSEAVRAGNLLFLSGQLGTDASLKLVPGGIKAETRQALENIRAVLERHGSSLDRVIKCTAMLADMQEWAAMNEVYVTFFPKHLPARSAFGTTGLALDARMELECIATVGT